MLAETWDVGPNVVAMVTALVGLGTLFVQQHFANKRTKDVQVKQEALLRDVTQTNGGSSTKDQLNRIEQQLQRGTKRFARIEEHLGLPPLPPPPPPPPVQ